ncbi:MAG: hypothetical protein ACFE0R_05720 [Salinarimonas sp.]
MRRHRISTAAVTSAALALGIAQASAQQASAQPDDWERDIPWIDATSVLESLPPGITDLGRTPPNALPGESTDELQQLIDAAHDGDGKATDAEAQTDARGRPLPRAAD